MSTVAAAKRTVVQAWVELISEDPEAVSALGVARATLAAGAGLKGLRRLRPFELRGALPAREAVAEMLHRSTRFYNPHKERCTVRAGAGDAAPLAADEFAALVWERDDVRRPAAERWWKHDAGAAIEVREAAVWTMRYDASVDAATRRARAESLLTARDRGHGLLCNPHAQDAVLADGVPPVEWLTTAGRRARRAPARRKEARS